ncbi:MAG: TonB-dependent receptor [Magnetospirillum gryphiswaldense]|nr:TonB-dependent receptor [Magnetospirillum gryphiswaldense]
MNSPSSPCLTGKAALLATTMLVGGALPALAQQAIELAPVEIEGKAPRAVETTSQIDQTEIDNEQPKDMRQLFRQEPSVIVSGGSAAAQKFYVHGIEQSNLNVSVDGATQRSNIWHHNGSMTLDPMFLKSVQVEAGVAPADAGPGALAGAVQMQTKDAKDMLLPDQDLGATLMASYNTNSQSFRTTGAAYGAQNGYEVLGILTRNMGENYINGDGNGEEGTKDHLQSGLAKLAYESQGGHRFGVSGEYADDNAIRRMRPNMGLVNNTSGRMLNTTRATRLTTGLSYETTTPTATYDPKVKLYYNRVGLQRPNDNNQTAVASGVFNSNIETMGLKAQNTFAIPTGKLTAGMDFENTDAFVRRYLQKTDADEQARNYGAFVQARVAPWDDWKLSTGLRADYQTYHTVDEKDFNNFGLSPNASVEYAFTPALSAFGGYSYVFGGLALPETGLLHAYQMTTKDDVNPTRSHNFRTGLRFGDNGLKLEGALFRTQMYDTLMYDYTRSTRINGPSLRSQGIDLSGSYEWANAKVWSKYNFTQARYAGRMALPSDYNLGTTVGHMLNLGAEYTFTPVRVTVGGSAEMTQGITDEALTRANYQPMKGYAVFDLFGQWQPLESNENWTVRLEANNVLDKKYVARGSYTTANNITPVYEEGRAFLLSTSVKF